ncbi:uncharacterized protein B0H18DRAFT_550263 [Fomitopsis serialis]|uniref:uncharacterized protein n=1 Tax=Fomitopsis serialis TaxID=139415 RepID=UPI00200844E1|nr:uncharacterized protein B0H18DRAFT_550263 [Neoantrodia serialis]KAH9934274.1 hypothetical protein B0H18DRAFT_550263 [Neoantrodia serialis]
MANSGLEDLLNHSVGYTFIGLLLGLIFYGFVLAQTVYYFHNYPKDPLCIQALVVFLWSLDTARTCCGLHYLWVCLVTSHSNVSGTAQFTTTAIAEHFLATWIIVVVQLFYVYSCWRFMDQQRHRNILTVTMVALALLCFCTVIIHSPVNQYHCIVSHSAGGLGTPRNG